jgi:hypothetical protein
MRKPKQQDKPLNDLSRSLSPLKRPTPGREHPKLLRWKKPLHQRHSAPSFVPTVRICSDGELGDGRIR